MLLDELEALLYPYFKMVSIYLLFNIVIGASHNHIVTMIQFIKVMYSNQAGGGAASRARLLSLDTFSTHSMQIVLNIINAQQLTNASSSLSISQFPSN